jgi:hypothetical protein
MVLNFTLFIDIYQYIQYIIIIQGRLIKIKIAQAAAHSKAFNISIPHRNAYDAFVRGLLRNRTAISCLWRLGAALY